MLPFGRLRRGGATFPANAQRRTITIAGPDELTAALVGGVERLWARGLAGDAGRIVTGEASSPTYKFAGYLAIAPPPGAVGNPLGSSRNLRRSPNVALPATSGDVVNVVAGGSVADSLAMIPPGVR